MGSSFLKIIQNIIDKISAGNGKHLFIFISESQCSLNRRTNGLLPQFFGDIPPKPDRTEWRTPNPCSTIDIIV